jgi:exonuclease III
MKLLSLNIRGVGGAPKSATLRRLLASIRPNILFLQETMVEGVKARALVIKHLPGWYCCASDSVGQWGICVAWNLAKMVLKPFNLCMYSLRRSNS